MTAKPYFARLKFRIDTLLRLGVSVLLFTLIPDSHAASKPQLNEAYGDLPLHFEVNQGQTAEQEVVGMHGSLVGIHSVVSPRPRGPNN